VILIILKNLFLTLCEAQVEKSKNEISLNEFKRLNEELYSLIFIKDPNDDDKNKLLNEFLYSLIDENNQVLNSDIDAFMKNPLMSWVYFYKDLFFTKIENYFYLDLISTKTPKFNWFINEYNEEVHVLSPYSLENRSKGDKLIKNRISAISAL
jgi:hypothetical protein